MRWMLPGLLLLSLGCWPQGGDELPGELIGQFEAVGLMVEQSCGAAIPAQDPLDLTFELRLEENGRAFWRQPGGAAFAGTGLNDEYTFQVSRSWLVVEPDQFRGYVGCSVTQRDIFTFVLEEPEVDPASDAGVDMEETDSEEAVIDPTLVKLTGSQSTDITPLTGSDCRPAVAALGGPFLALPCRIEYVLTGNGI
ncbi:MAG: hypothetical protein O7F08_00805 [Deltaproteobacteria bacterium]|nr:hypothetical protein [Deltaproteobacteria bacterium]